MESKQQRNQMSLAVIVVIEAWTAGAIWGITLALQHSINVLILLTGVIAGLAMWAAIPFTIGFFWLGSRIGKHERIATKLSGLILIAASVIFEAVTVFSTHHIDVLYIVIPIIAYLLFFLGRKLSRREFSQ